MALITNRYDHTTHIKSGSKEYPPLEVLCEHFNKFNLMPDPWVDIVFLIPCTFGTSDPQETPTRFFEDYKPVFKSVFFDDTQCLPQAFSLYLGCMNNTSE